MIHREPMPVDTMMGGARVIHRLNGALDCVPAGVSGSGADGLPEDGARAEGDAHPADVLFLGCRPG